LPEKWKIVSNIKGEMQWYWEASYAENELEHRVVFPACAITLATKKPLAEEDTLLQCGIIEASDVELKDNFFY
jgi:hypothetical protein